MTTIKDEYLKKALQCEAPLLFDGAMGTMLQRAGLSTSERPELLCTTNPDAITAIHRAYVEAGSQVATTNTFGANRLNLGSSEQVAAVFAAAVACARQAGARYVAADLGPLGEFLDPIGDIEFDEAVELFAEQARAGAEAGADIVIVETMTDLNELKAAVMGAQSACDLPVFATMTFGESGRTFMGAGPEDAVNLLVELGANALGVNCSLGPEKLEPIVSAMLALKPPCPVIVQANAGLPEIVDGVAHYGIGPAAYAQAVKPMIEKGATIIGGCCGTDPTYIAELARLLF